MKRKILAIGLLIAVLFLSVGCQSVSTEKPYVSVNGAGTTKATPDLVQINITVATEKEDASAQSDNAEKVEKIIAVLKGLGLEENEIKTTGANFYPNSRWEDGKEIDLGFRAENFLMVETKKLDLIGKIIDDTVAQGAERVSGLSFSLSDEAKENLLAEILESAVADARIQAETTVKALGQELAGVKSVTVIKEYNYPIYRAAEAIGLGEKAASTPILPGEVDYNISVAVDFFIN